MMSMEPVIQVFGEYTIADAMVVVIAVVIVIKFYMKFKKCVVEEHDKTKEKDEKLKDISNRVDKHLAWHEESSKNQADLKKSVERVVRSQEELAKKIDDVEEQNRNRRCNELRDMLLQSYRFYTNKEKNPMQAISEMESEAFWDLYANYEELGGNSHVHDVVRPAMRELEVIKVSDAERFEELTQSRR